MDESESKVAMRSIIHGLSGERFDAILASCTFTLTESYAVNAPAPASADFDFQIHRMKFDNPGRPDSIPKCTKDVVRGDFLRPPHKH